MYAVWHLRWPMYKLSNMFCSLKRLVAPWGWPRFKTETCRSSDWLTDSMEQTPSWEANTSSASQEISRILWNPKVHHRIHNIPPPVPIPSQIDTVHPHPTALRSILILSSHLRLRLPSGLLPSGFPTKALYASLLVSIRATSSAHLSLLDLITGLIFGEAYGM